MILIEMSKVRSHRVACPVQVAARREKPFFLWIFENKGSLEASRKFLAKISDKKF